MAILIDIILPVFGTVFLAYGIARLGWFPEAAADHLSRFVFNFALPPMLFHAMAEKTLPEQIEWGFLISFFGGGYLVWALAMVISVWWFRRDIAHAAFAGKTAAFGNTVLLGIPLVLAAFGEAATLPVFLIIAFHSWQYCSLVTILVAGSRGNGNALAGIPLAILRSLLTNPVLLGMLAGLAWNILDLPLPRPVAEITGFIGGAAAPSAVFAMGASLARYRLSGALPEALVGSALKLLLFPALTWILATHIFDVAPLWRDVAVVTAALPVGVNVYLFAERYKAGTAAAATSILVSTFLSFATIAGVLHFLAAN